MILLLFDMDGVLLEPRGYHRALQETVARVGRLLGYQAAELRPDDVAAFEAAGVTSEWDSSAMCAALMLEKLWGIDPTLALPSTPAAPPRPVHSLLPPDFQAFAHDLAQADLPAARPLQRAEQLLLGREKRTDGQRRIIRDILRTARQIEGSLTHRIFQELVLGSQQFVRTYGLAPSFDTESYLRQYDRPLLTERETGELRRWLQASEHGASIFTARPSRRPAGPGGTPEAEIGAQSVRLGGLPIVGLGGLSWLGERRDRDLGDLLKPAATHALAALRLALGDGVQTGLEAAAALALDGQADPGWHALQDGRVYVFEDTVVGLLSAQAARDRLAEIGVSLRLTLVGVTDHAQKRRALEAVGAVVYSGLSTALQGVPRSSPVFL